MQENQIHRSVVVPTRREIAKVSEIRAELDPIGDRMKLG
jgi:hypothetical protein